MGPGSRFRYPILAMIVTSSSGYGNSCVLISSRAMPVCLFPFVANVEEKGRYGWVLAGLVSFLVYLKRGVRIEKPSFAVKHPDDPMCVAGIYLETWIIAYFPSLINSTEQFPKTYPAFDHVGGRKHHQMPSVYKTCHAEKNKYARVDGPSCYDPGGSSGYPAWDGLELCGSSEETVLELSRAFTAACRMRLKSAGAVNKSSGQSSTQHNQLWGQSCRIEVVLFLGHWGYSIVSVLEHSAAMIVAGEGMPSRPPNSYRFRNAEGELYEQEIRRRAPEIEDRGLEWVKETAQVSSYHYQMERQHCNLLEFSRMEIERPVLPLCFKAGDLMSSEYHKGYYNIRSFPEAYSKTDDSFSFCHLDPVARPGPRIPYVPMAYPGLPDLPIFTEGASPTGLSESSNYEEGSSSYGDDEMVD